MSVSIVKIVRRGKKVCQWDEYKWKPHIQIVSELTENLMLWVRFIRRSKEVFSSEETAPASPVTPSSSVGRK